MSSRHQEGLAHLLYGITAGGGFVALTGEVGTGKTTLCRCLVQELPKNIDIALILNPKLNAIELLATVCDELAISYVKNQPSLKNLVDSLNRHLLFAHASGRRTVLLIDEAQNLSMEVLEQIRLLTNLETSKDKLLQIILVGQPELKELLARQDLRQLNQRITARYHLLPLSLFETRAYVRHRVKACGGNPDLFKDSAIKSVYRLSSGVPRIINIICDRALLGAYANNKKVITREIVKNAARETLGTASHRNRRIPILLFLMLLSIFIFGFYHSEKWIRMFNRSPSIELSKKKQERIEKINVVAVKQQATMNVDPGVSANVSATNKINFVNWINNPALTLSAGIGNALKLWGKAPLESVPSNCDQVRLLNLNCILGKTSWKGLLSIDRPILLEFILPDGMKRYVLLTGINQDEVVVHDNKDLAFPVADVLRYWDGNYLMLRQPPFQDVIAIYPGQTSQHVPWIRRKLALYDGVEAQPNDPLFFDSKLKSRVKAFQRRFNLTEDGIVGLKTLLYLDSLRDSNSAPIPTTID